MLASVHKPGGDGGAAVPLPGDGWQDGEALPNWHARIPVDCPSQAV